MCFCCLSDGGTDCRLATAFNHHVVENQVSSDPDAQCVRDEGCLERYQICRTEATEQDLVSDVVWLGFMSQEYAAALFIVAEDCIEKGVSLESFMASY